LQVIKQDGTLVPFDASKPRNWIRWAVRNAEQREVMEQRILTQTLAALTDSFTTAQLHDRIISVCLDEEDIDYARVAAQLELATIYKNQARQLDLYKPESASFMDYLELFERHGKWSGDWLEETIGFEDLLNEWYIELEELSLEYWTIKQWVDKYSLKHNGHAIETPALGCLAIALAYHGISPLAFNVAKDLLEYRMNLPTPALNGVRNDDYNSISCCVIEANDTIESIDVADFIASEMTAKKAGIGITLDTRSKGDSVKNGTVTHLGKAPLYRSIESSVKKYTHISRGGSATMTFKAIDPEIMSMLLWKTQRIDLAQRIDKIDYSFSYNDTFVRAVINQEDWYLFGLQDAPEVHANYHAENYEDYVRAAVASGTPYKKVKALDVLKTFLSARWETGRVYCINVTTANRHTPFDDTITQGNLCMEIQLPTKGYLSLSDFQEETYTDGETAFCSLAAHNVANIPEEDYFAFSERSLRTVHEMIMRAPMMNKGMRTSLLARKSVGIGITGLASMLYKAGLDFDGSDESLEAVERIAELHYYSLLKASQKMVEDGTAPAVEGIDLDWLPIDTKTSDRDPILDWESLRGKPRAHSVLVAHMPTESSAVFSNATNGLYPSRNRVIYKKARRGKIQFISEFFDSTKTPAWNVDMVPYYKVIQGYTDQAISADYYTDFTKYPNKKIPMVALIKWFLDQALAGVKTAYYQNFKVDEVEEFEQEETCDSGGCKL